MRLILSFTLLILSFLLSKAQAETRLVLDVAQETIDVTTGFNGARVFIHGNIETDQRSKDLSDIDVAIILKGPERTTTVRRKEQILGMWMNTQYEVFDDVYSFYDFAITRSVQSISTDDILTQHNIGLDYLNFEASKNINDPSLTASFHEALIRSKQAKGLYALSAQPVTYLSGSFFKTTFFLPPSVPTGIYQIEGYIFHDQELLGKKTLELNVAQIGINANIYKFAENHAFLYGFCAICLALTLGWSAHAFLRE